MRQLASGFAWAQEQSPTWVLRPRGDCAHLTFSSTSHSPFSCSKISCSVISDPVQELPDPSQLLWTTLHGKEGKWPALVRASLGTGGSALGSLAWLRAECDQGEGFLRNIWMKAWLGWEADVFLGLCSTAVTPEFNELLQDSYVSVKLNFLTPCNLKYSFKSLSLKTKQTSLFSFALRELCAEVVAADNITGHRMSWFLSSEISTVWTSIKPTVSRASSP